MARRTPDTHDRHPVKDTMRRDELFDRLEKALSSMKDKNTLGELDERYVAFDSLRQLIREINSRLKTMEQVVDNIGHLLEEERKKYK